MGTKVYDNALDLITFSRNSGGTSLRKISYGDELVTNGTFDSDVSGWNSYSGGILTFEAGELKLTGNPGDLTYGATQSLSTVVGKVYSVSISVRTDGTAYLRVGTAAGSFSLVNENTSSATNTTITAVFTATATTTVITLQGSTDATSYFDNVSVKEVLFDQPDGTLQLFNHPADIPRIDYSPDGTAKGLLIEEQRTNSATYSEDFSNSSWLKLPTNALSSETVAGPFEGTTAYRFTSVDHNHLLEDRNVPVTAGTTYTFSFWGKDAGGAGTPKYRVYDVTNAADIIRADWVDYGSTEFKRQVVTFTAPSGCTQVTVSVVSYSGLQVDFYVYGAQLEAGAFPTSYIPTSGSTVTRAADVASIPVSAFGYNQSAGTVVVEATKSSSTGNNRYFELSNASADSRFSVFQSGTNASGFGAVEGGVVCNLQFSTIGIDQVKAGFTFTENDFAFCLNGGSVSTDTAGAFPNDLSTLFIGKYPALDTFQLNGHIKSIQYFPRRLTNAQIVELTS